MNPKITIAIPSHNNQEVIAESIESALNQAYPNKEILVIDDCSTDKTIEVVKKYPVRLIVNDKNLGIGFNLVELMNEAKGKYITYLCADDLFASRMVITDIVNQFDNGDPAIGVIGRYTYFFMHGKLGAIGVSRETNILLQSCCPSGMSFRVRKDIQGNNGIFVEMPYIVSQYIRKSRWTMFEYDTVACRFHPGYNTGTKKEYYTQSVTQNWIDLVGKDFKSHAVFVMLKNRAPKMLFNEIKVVVKNNKKVLLDWQFWVYIIIALTIPSFILKKLTILYRDNVTRRFAKIIERPS